MDQNPETASKPDVRRWTMPAVAFFTVLVLGGGVFYYFYSDEPPKSEPVARATTLAKKQILRAFPRVPRPPVFSPGLPFADQETTASYQAARDNPDLLEKLPCYCGCFQQGHSSNYDCFVDNHGAVCELCRQIALTAQKLRKAGQKDDQILAEINERYAR